jgi:Ca2+-dependent lipid-binding protein
MNISTSAGEIAGPVIASLLSMIMQYTTIYSLFAMMFIIVGTSYLFMIKQDTKGKNTKNLLIPLQIEMS